MPASLMPSVTFTNPTTRHTFRVEKPLGSGSFGKVYLTRRDRIHYAVKVVELRDLSSSARAEVQEEVDILRTTTGHDNIVRYHESWWKGNDFHIVLEYASNGTLQTFMEKHKRAGKAVPEMTVTHYLKQLASALHYCHYDLHIVHRDIKPANILIDSFGSLKLTDFGVSKRVVMDMNRAFCVTQAGTPMYMAPEMLANKPYDFKVDVWMLGCCVYELCAFHLPFGRRCHTMHDLVNAIQYAPVDSAPLRGYSRPLRAVVLWMLKKEPDDRPSMRDLCDHFSVPTPPDQSSMLEAAAASIQMRFRGSRRGRVAEVVPTRPSAPAPVARGRPYAAAPPVEIFAPAHHPLHHPLHPHPPPLEPPAGPAPISEADRIDAEMRRINDVVQRPGGVGFVSRVPSPVSEAVVGMAVGRAADDEEADVGRQPIGTMRVVDEDEIEVDIPELKTKVVREVEEDEDAEIHELVTKMVANAALSPAPPPSAKPDPRLRRPTTFRRVAPAPRPSCVPSGGPVPLKPLHPLLKPADKVAGVDGLYKKPSPYCPPRNKWDQQDKVYNIAAFAAVQPVVPSPSKQQGVVGARPVSAGQRPYGGVTPTPSASRLDQLARPKRVAGGEKQGGGGVKQAWM